jgi:sugar lactone lactonase YvrE
MTARTQKGHVMKRLSPACVVFGLLAVAAPPASAQAPAAATPCNVVTDVQLVCGQAAPEDLVVLPGSEWVVASAFADGGGINVIRVSDRTTTRVYPSPSAKKQFDTKTYAGCPGPPDAAAGAEFTTHGLWLQPGRGTVHRLFAVGHGSRESIEVFDIDAHGTTPVATWIGCAVAPDPIGLNSVRGLPDGGFIATNFLARGVTAAARQQMLDGAKNGELWEWHTSKGWQKVPGSDASGANGIELSADGRTLYVAQWGSQSFARLSRGRTPPTRQEIPLGFRVDNIRFAKDGSLLAVGQGQQSSDIVSIDPKTLGVKRLLHRQDDGSFRAGTVAVEVGDTLWVGSYVGDRIAIFPKP